MDCIFAGLALLAVGVFLLYRDRRQSANKSDGGPGEEGGK